MTKETATADAVETVDQASETEASPDQGNGVEAWRNPREIKKSLAKTRALEKEVAGLRESMAEVSQFIRKFAPPTAEDAPAPDVHDVLARELEFRDALDDAGLDGHAKSLVKRLYKAEKPADPLGWLQTLDVQGMKQPPPTEAPVAAAPPRRDGTTNSGPPGRRPNGNLPTDPRILARDYPDVWRAMGREKRLQMQADHRRSTGGGSQISQLFSNRRKPQ